MKAFKFLVPLDNTLPLPTAPSITFTGCLAVIPAVDEQAARMRLIEWATREGFDVRWLAVARVTEVEIVDGVVLAFVM